MGVQCNPSGPTTLSEQNHLCVQTQSLPSEVAPKYMKVQSLLLEVAPKYMKIQYLVLEVVP